MKQIIQKLLEKEAAQKKAEMDKITQQQNESTDGRRDFFKKTAALGGMALSGFMFSPFEDTFAQSTSKVNRNSAPSDLKITDLRYAVVMTATGRSPILRIDT